jgi:hypothetical protein
MDTPYIAFLVLGVSNYLNISEISIEEESQTYECSSFVTTLCFKISNETLQLNRSNLDINIKLNSNRKMRRFEKI